MKSIRLTASIKNEVIENMHKALIAPKKLEIVRRRNKLADKVYDDTYSAKDIEFMYKAPEGALGYVTGFYVKFHGKTCSSYYLEMPKARPVFYSMHSSITKLVYTTDHVLSKEFSALQEEETALYKSKQQLTDTTRQLMNSVTTIKRLLEVWPEVAEFLPSDTEQTANLPAVPVESLNVLVNSLRG